MTLGLLVVKCIMLHANSHAILLNFLNIRHYHHTGEARVLTHIFEVASVQRSPVDIDSRSEQHILLAVAGLLSYGFAVEGGHFLAPGSGKAGKCRESDAGVIGPACLPPLVPKHFRTYAVRTVRTPEVRNSKTRHTCRRELALCV